MFRTPLKGRYVSPVTVNPLTDKPEPEPNGTFPFKARLADSLLSSSDLDAVTVKLQFKVARLEASILPKVQRATF